MIVVWAKWPFERKWLMIVIVSSMCYRGVLAMLVELWC